MGDGYEVDPGRLQESAKGINDTISELKTLGIDEEAEEGRGFDNLAMDNGQVGHPRLTEAFSGFTDRWGWGVRSLVKDGNEIASRLGLSAGTYYDMEQYAIGAFKDAVNSVAGDPHASSQQVENESFGQMMSKDAPDYSAASWDKLGQDAKATWSAEGRDLAEGPMGLGKTIADATGNGQAFSQAEDQVFGPAPSSDNASGSGSGSGSGN